MSHQKRFWVTAVAVVAVSGGGWFLVRAHQADASADPVAAAPAVQTADPVAAAPAVQTADVIRTEVRSVLPATIDPNQPGQVQVSRPSGALAAKRATESTFSALFLGAYPSMRAARLTPNEALAT